MGGVKTESKDFDCTFWKKNTAKIEQKIANIKLKILILFNSTSMQTLTVIFQRDEEDFETDLGNQRWSHRLRCLLLPFVRFSSGNIKL